MMGFFGKEAPRRRIGLMLGAVTLLGGCVLRLGGFSRADGEGRAREGRRSSARVRVSAQTPAPANANPPPAAESSPHGRERLLRAFDFEDQRCRQSPAGFDCKAGAWLVRHSQDADRGRHVLCQGDPGDQYSWCLAREPSFGDGELSVRWRALSGLSNQGGGLLFRDSPGGAYLLRVNPKDPPAPLGNLALYFQGRGENAQRSLLAVVELKDFAEIPPLEPGQWHRLHARAQGRVIEGGIDGHWILRFEDERALPPGRIGLWTNSTAVTEFDALEVSLAPETAAQ